MKFLRKFIEGVKYFFRTLGMGWILMELVLLFLFLYLTFVDSEYYVIADISLAVGAGLSTGLTIYALTNHRSKKERELGEILTISQRAINNYFTLRHSLATYHSTLRYSEYKRDVKELKSDAETSWEEIMENGRLLRHINHNTLPELDKFDKIYDSDFFSWAFKKRINRLFENKDEEECFTYLMEFDDETRELKEVLRYINTRAETELWMLQRSLI